MGVFARSLSWVIAHLMWHERDTMVHSLYSLEHQQRYPDLFWREDDLLCAVDTDGGSSSSASGKRALVSSSDVGLSAGRIL